MGIYYNFKKIFNFKIPVFFKKLLKSSYGKNNLDIELEKYLNYTNGFFIELGAHDGITQSNTFYPVIYDNLSKFHITNQLVEFIYILCL